MKNLLLILTLILFNISLFAQFHDNIWLMGYDSDAVNPIYGGTTLNFSESPPLVVKHDRDMNFRLTSASYADSVGNLLFYTNGIYIANKLHELMENGDSLNPGPIANMQASDGYGVYQSEFFLQLPDNPNLFYLFHMKFDWHDVFVTAVTTLYITQIDLTLNDSLGAVTIKNEEILTDGRFGTITAVKHANGRDWWILTCEQTDNKYFKFLFTPEGLSDVEEFELQPEFPEIFSNGPLVFSPDGTKFARYEVNHGAYVYDFDRCTGTFSNPQFVGLPETTLGGGAAISPNSRFLYVSTKTKLYYRNIFIFLPKRWDAKQKQLN